MINLSLPSVTSLYVGTKNVYVAQTRRTVFGLRLLKFGQVEIQPPAPTQNPASNQEQSGLLVAAIKEVLRENNITDRKVITALPGKDVLIRYFQIPKIPKYEWEQAIKFESKKYIPFRIEELMWDFHVVLTKGKKNMDVTFAAVKRDVAENYLEQLRRSGLEVQALEPAPFSLLRMLSATKQLTKDKPAAVVDIDQGMADINIVKNQSCFLTRDVSLPLEKELVFESLLNEIRMSLDYYEKLFPTEIVERIFLSGELELEDWDRHLEAELKVRTEKVNLIKVTGLKRAAPSLNMAVAIGLGLRGKIKDTAEVNLCREPAISAKVQVAARGLQFTPQVRQAIIRATIFSAAGLLILYMAMYRAVALESSRLKEVISLRPQVELPVERLSYADLQNRKEELTQKIFSLALIIDNQIFWTNKINQLPKMVVPELWLIELNLQEGLVKEKKLTRSLELKGAVFHQEPAKEIEMITKFISQLKENQEFSRGFKQIELLSMAPLTLGEIQVKQFRIRCEN